MSSDHNGSEEDEEQCSDGDGSSEGSSDQEGDDDDFDAEKEEEQEVEEEGDDPDEEIAIRHIGNESLISKHCHQQRYAWMTYAVQLQPADNSYDVVKPEEEDKTTNGAVVANDQQNAEAEVDEEEGSADCDVNEGGSAHNSEEDDESQVSCFNALALQARDSSTIFSKPNKLYAAF